jgi:hypothetical protein
MILNTFQFSKHTPDAFWVNEFCRIEYHPAFALNLMGARTSNQGPLTSSCILTGSGRLRWARGCTQAVKKTAMSRLH